MICLFFKFVFMSDLATAIQIFDAISITIAREPALSMALP